MKKQSFISLLNAIEREMKRNVKDAEILTKVFRNANSADLLPSNEQIFDAMIEVLSNEFELEKDECGYDWITWFIYENDFGKNKMKAYYKDGKEIKIRNASDLWNFLDSERVK